MLSVLPSSLVDCSFDNTSIKSNSNLKSDKFLSEISNFLDPKLYIDNLEIRNFIDPKLYIDNHWMVLYTIFIFFYGSEIQDALHTWQN
jgi:hypothetical protein